jgi:glycosyltransferase involved in cell wall biosynthesis
MLAEERCALPRRMRVTSLDHPIVAELRDERHASVLAGAHPAVTFAGALPPPVTGMTAMTLVIVEALVRRGPVRLYNWSRGKPLQGWRWKLARTWGAIKTMFGLLASGAARGGTFYYPVSRGRGLNYDLVLVGLARTLGYRVVLHHHSYSYINHRDWRAGRLARLAHAHAVHCELMRRDFLRQYDTQAEFWIVPPTIVSQQMTPLPATPRTAFALGFLSNVMLEKGIDEAIQTFERLAGQGRDVRLIVAGPCKGRVERELVDAAVTRWPGRVEYRGPVYGNDKARFFADVDVLLFPTRYKTESWGIVLTEALNAGCPVIARSRGCVSWIVDEACGLAVPPGADFLEPAAALIGRWMDSPEELAAARRAARRRSAELQANADRELPEFVERFFAGAGAGGATDGS